MKSWRFFLFAILLTIILSGLVSCAPAAAPEEAAEEVSEAAPAEAAEPEEVEEEAEAEQAQEAPPLPSVTPSPAPTQPAPISTQPSPATAQPAVTPTSWTEERMIELEYPSRMHKGDSDILRLSLVYSEDGYSVTTEFEDHTVDVQELPLEYKPGYQLSAAARLDGAGFNISPSHEKEQPVQPGKDVTWHWSLKPQTSGRHRLSVSLFLRWYAEDAPYTPLLEEQVLSQALEIQVSSFLGLGRIPAFLSSMMGLLLGSSLSLGTLLIRRQDLPALQTRQPNPKLVIEPAPDMKIPPEETNLLRALFQRYARLTLAGEFLSGYSGASTYLALPITSSGQSDAATIVKIGPRHTIQQEYANYQHFVKDRLPPITARIQHAPVVLQGQDLAAMQYTFIAEPGRNPTSLRLSLLQNPQPELLNALFETFGPSWWMQRQAYTFRPSQEYDRLLPPHYVLQPITSSQERPDARLHENTNPYALNLKAGDIVQIDRFKQYEMRADRKSLTLIGNPNAGQPPIRLRWLGTQPPKNTKAIVSETQNDLFAGYVRNFERYGLPDPLERLDEVLAAPIQGTRSIIHGDLNLENVLVGPGGLVWLIDFAQTRTGHTLFDFARLGTELIAHILSQKSTSPQAYLQILQSGGDPLWQAVQQIAQRCLFNQSQAREMDIAQYLACLGALKFNNLSPHAKHCLYLTAAEISTRL